MTTGPTTVLAIPAPAPLAVSLPARLNAAQLYQLWLRSQDSEQTRRSYTASIRQFADYVRAPSPEAAVEFLLGMDRGSANALAEGWRADLKTRLAPNSANARLTALRSLCNSAKRFGLTEWSIAIENMPSRSYRDVRGPGRANFIKMRGACEAQGETRKAKRDMAVLRMLHDLALRSAELLGLRIEDLDLAGGRIWILGKGRTQRESITMPDATRQALAAWLAVRGDATTGGYVFCRIWGAGSFERPLCHKSLWEIVKRYGAAVGVKSRPHGLRHSGISRAAELVQGDMLKVAAFARHANLNTTRIYIDDLRDHAGSVAKLVAAD